MARSGNLSRSPHDEPHEHFADARCAAYRNVAAAIGLTTAACGSDEPASGELLPDATSTTTTEISEAELDGYYAALSTGSGAGTDLSISTTGEVLMSFTETDYLYVGDFELSLSVAGQSGSGVATGTVDGTWEAVDGIIVTELGSSNLNIVVTVSGMTMDGSDLGNGFAQANPINDAPFDCDGPTIMFPIGS